MSPLLPDQTNQLLETVASFLSGQLLQEFDHMDTAVKEKSKSFLLTKGNRTLQISKDNGLVTEYKSKHLSLQIVKYKKVENSWLPETMKFNFKSKGSRKNSPKQFQIDFSGLSLKKIENRIFEVRQK